MTDRPAGSSDPFMGAIVLVLTALLAAIVALSAGMTWERLLHWAGELLLISGILLAAKGISDLRREWTSRPGFWGGAAAARTRAAAFLWRSWNLTVVRMGWLARLLRLRPRSVTGTVNLNLPAARFTSTAHALSPRVGPPTTGTVEDRLAWLEAQAAGAQKQIDEIGATHLREVQALEAAIEEAKAAQQAGMHRVDARMANLAGGGLRLQAWGVVCLLAGTLLTAFWP